MAKESIILELNTETPWDGVSPTNLNRDDAIVTGQRYYKHNIAGPHGLIGPEMGGLFAAFSAKIVGIAISSWNPENKARIICPDALGTYRQEITLKPEIQYVVMYPGDKLALFTQGAREQVFLSVNEMTEQDAVTWSLGHGPTSMPTRFRIIRTTGAAFVANPGALWQPNFVHDPATGLLVATEDATGMLPANSLCLYPRFQGCYVSIRYAGSSGNGKLHIVDNLTRKTWQAETAMTDVKWSRVQFVSHDDGIALEATAGIVGQPMVCDIELALVHPGNRLSGRFQGGL